LLNKAFNSLIYFAHIFSDALYRSSSSAYNLPVILVGFPKFDITRCKFFINGIWPQ